MTSWILRALSPCALVLALALPSNAGDAPQAPLIVKGRVLAVDASYLVFTTGDAVRLGDGVRGPSGLALGATVRVRIDPTRRVVTAVETASGTPAPGEIDANALPRDVVAVDPRAARSAEATGSAAGGGTTGAVTVTIDVAVPDVTPLSDDVYLSTDRTNFASAELRMNRVDALDWSISLPLPSGSTLRYEFTRGSPGNVERNRNGSIVDPRALTATAGLHTKDRVARWADRF